MVNDDLKRVAAMRSYTFNGHTFPISRPDLSDNDVAGIVRMLLRNQLNHEHVCCMARDRIMCLSGEKADLLARLDAVEKERDALAAAQDRVKAMQEQLDDQAAHDGELIAALTAERDEAREWLGSANNEFGSCTWDWPDLWRRISKLKELSNERWKRAKAAEARVKELEGAAHGLLNWCDVLLATVQETSCDPEDPDAFDQAIMGVQMFASQCRAAINMKGPTDDK